MVISRYRRIEIYPALDLVPESGPSNCMMGPRRDSDVNTSELPRLLEISKEAGRDEGLKIARESLLEVRDVNPGRAGFRAIWQRKVCAGSIRGVWKDLERAKKPLTLALWAELSLAMEVVDWYRACQ